MMAYATWFGRNAMMHQGIWSNMSTVLIAVFDGDEKASQGTAVLNAMKSEGAVDVNAMAVVRRHVDNRVTVEGNEIPQGVKPVFVGLIAGSLVGLLLGPMGAAVGGLVGFSGGISYMAADGDSASAFLDEVAGRIGPSTTALIVEFREEVDQNSRDRLKELGARLFWTTRQEIQRSMKETQLREIIADDRRRRSGPQ
jgi:uncharacterized membrane protein